MSRTVIANLSVWRVLLLSGGMGGVSIWILTEPLRTAGGLDAVLAAPADRSWLLAAFASTAILIFSLLFIAKLAINGQPYLWIEDGFLGGPALKRKVALNDVVRVTQRAALTIQTTGWGPTELVLQFADGSERRVVTLVLRETPGDVASAITTAKAPMSR